MLDSEKMANAYANGWEVFIGTASDGTVGAAFVIVFTFYFLPCLGKNIWPSQLFFPKK